MIINKKLKFFAAMTAISILPVQFVVQAEAANNLMELFGKNKKQTESLPAPQRAPKAYPLQRNIQAPQRNIQAPQKNIQAPPKRVVIAAPRALVYMPEKLVKVDFSNTNFLQILAIREEALSMVPPYMVIDEASLSIPSVKSAELLQRNFPIVDVRAEKEIAETLVKFYAQEGQLVWSKDFAVSKNAKDLMDYLSHAADDGLSPDEYAVSVPEKGLEGEAREEAFARFDILLSARALRYVRDASGGRIIANRLSKFHDIPRNKVDLDDALHALTMSANPSEMLASYLPSSPSYLALKQTLVALNKSSSGTPIAIKAGTLIRPGQENGELPKVVALIQRRASLDYLKTHKDVLKNHADSTLYDPELVQAFKDYQKSIGKTADGIIGPATINALQGNSDSIKRQRVLYSMERLRWLPHDFTQRYIFINQPSYRAQYFEDGVLKLDMKVVVGSLLNQTTFFYDKIRMVQFNPSWGVPRSIVLNEMMPRIMNDPSYLSRNGYTVYDARGRVVTPGQVDWGKVSGTGYGVNIRQQPGRGNALGELKILFPNKHDIYLHDTPNKSAFQRDMRAISHGCVRLEDPRAMAAAVLDEKVSDLLPYFKRKENTINVNQKIPIFLAYFTAWPDAKTGDIQYFDDVYGRDNLMTTADEKTHDVRVSVVKPVPKI